MIQLHKNKTNKINRLGVLLMALGMAVVGNLASAAETPAEETAKTTENAGTGGSLEDNFKSPPREFSMVPLWSWNGRLEPDQLRWQIDQMVAQGVYGAFMHARAGINTDDTPYFSEGWWQAVEACVEHGEKVGFDTWLYDEDKWPSGAAGGRTIQRNPERNRQKVLHRSELRVHGPQDVKLEMPDAQYIIAGRLTHDTEFDPGSLQDLRNNRDEGSPWSCPQGDWVIYGYTFEEREGVNYLNKETIRDFIDITHEEYYKRFGDHFGTTIPGVFFDEIQNDSGKDPSCVVWAEGFAERFKAIKGYDLLPLLPALSTDIGPTTPKIRCDYYDVYTTIYEEAWFQQLADWCGAHGIEVTGHTVEELNRYTTQGNYLRTMRHLQIPTTDNEDFRYTWPRTIDPWKPKQLASITHLYGHPRSGVEAMGGAGWCFNLDMGRYGFNMLSAYGINFFISHLFHYAQDRPANVDDWPNSWFFRNPYWKYFKTFADHGSRLSTMLTGGEHVVDVAVLYPETNSWAGYGPGWTQEAIADLVGAQIDADLIDPESLLRAEIRDASLHVGAMNYRVLIVPGIDCIRLAEAEKIFEFLKAKGVVIVLDRWPSHSMENGKDDPGLVEFRKKAQGLYSVQLTAHDNLIQTVRASFDTDVIVRDRNDSEDNPLRYHHIRRDEKDIYWIVNSGRNPGTWPLSFRAVGAPSLWQPEDGSITPITLFTRREEFMRQDRMQCTVALDGWQGCFVVFDNKNEPMRGGIKITNTNLHSIEKSLSNDNQLLFTGYLSPQTNRIVVEADVFVLAAGGQCTANQETEPAPGPIQLNQNWRFLPVAHLLDEEWRVDVESARLELPVMRVRWEREGGEAVNGWHLPACNDSRWRKVKILDTLHADEGADRYRSKWSARFISHMHYTPFDLEFFFRPTIGGKGLSCQNTFVLPPEATGARLAVICESPFRVLVDGEEKAHGQGGKEPECFELRGLRPGECTLGIEAEDSRVILAEGEFLCTDSSRIPIFTDETWQICTEQQPWTEAWEYVAPPERPFGEPSHPWIASRPNMVWYRAQLPAGVTAIETPKIEGDWQAWADGKPLEFSDGKSKLPSGTRLLAIRVALSENEHGLMEPIGIHCEAAEAPLGSWAEQNLDWYSGRAIYSTEFDLTDTYLQDDIHLELDLGKVCYCAEVWLNGELAGTRVWPPYRVDITKYAQAGHNRLQIVAANLLANRMRWDIFDDVKSSLGQRKWHDSHIRRDAWCLQSGLIGPVQITPCKKVTVRGEPVK